MAIVNLKDTRQSNGDLGALAARIATIRAEKGSDFVSADEAKLAVGAEGFKNATVQDKLLDVYHELSSAAAEVGIENLTPAQLTAGAMAAVATKAGKEYQTRVMNTATKASTEGFTSGFDYKKEPAYGIEAYDASTIDKHATFSIVYAMMSARQGPLAELFYPTIVASTDEAGVQVSFSYPVVFKAKKHATDGSVTDFEERRLIEASVDSTVLGERTTELVPWYDASNPDNVANYTTEVAAFNTTQAGVEFPTNYLAPNKDIGVIGLGQNPGVQADGTLDHTDVLDRRIGIKSIAVKVTDDAGTASVIDLPLNTLRQAFFTERSNGDSRDMVLAFQSTGLVITGKTLDVTNVAAPALAFLNAAPYKDWIIRLSANITGTTNLATGKTNVKGDLYLESATEMVNGKPVQVIDATQLAALKAKLPTIEFVGYQLDGRYANSNMRRQGLLVDTRTKNQQYNVWTTSPITAVKPQAAVPTTVDFAAPLATARKRNDTNAVTALTGYAAQLEAQDVNSLPYNRVTEIEGIGGYSIFPFFARRKVSMTDLVNSVSSSNRAFDVAASIIDVIRDLGYKMLERTNYQEALDLLTGNTGTKPCLIVGTSPRVERHLFLQGDTRIASVGMEIKHASSTDERIRDDIYISFGRPGSNDIDPLGFGNTIMIPELVTEITSSRDNSHSRELMVQPRVLHINNLPALAVIELEDIEDVHFEAVPVRVA